MAPEFSLASFNTHWGVDTSARPFDVVGTCVALDADVLVLQEAWRPAQRPSYVDEIASRCGAVVHEIPHVSDQLRQRPRGVRPDLGPPGSCGLAIITRLPVRDRFDVSLPPAPGDVVHRRWALCLVVEVGSTAVVVGGIHASHRLYGSLPQIRKLDRAVRRRKHPSVIAGDMNMWGPAVKAVVPTRHRAVRGPTWPARLPHSQIDHIWVDRHLDVVDAAVMPDAGSDHRPVRARLTVR